MVIYMKTTVVLPDELFTAAKRCALETRRPLRELIENGLRDQLSAVRARPRKQRSIKLRWITVNGGLPVGVDIADRTAMYEMLQREP